jgi:hypothetical protein
MMITIDLGGDGDILVDGTKAKDDVAEKHRLEEERKENWLRWVRQNEQVVPQIIPVTQR